MSFPLTRFDAVSRRSFLRGAAAVGAAVVVPACSNGDSAELGTETIATRPTDTAASTVASTQGSTTVSSATTDPATTAAAQPPAGDALPASAQLQVNFTYSASGDRVRNPYIAVWVETVDGEMVNTVSLWLRRNKSRYLDHLKRWYNAEAALLDAGGVNNLDALAGASRPAGDYQVVWDCTGIDGERVAAGDYVVCIEAAREHGPYELITGQVTLGNQAFDEALEDNGELSNASVVFVV